MNPTISILIITYNRPEDTLDLLKSLNEQNNIREHVGEILILNNNSSVSYSSIEEYTESHPDLKIKYIPHDKNLGVAGGRNFLIRTAQYPFLLVLDDDVVIPDNNAIIKASSLFAKKEFKENNTAIITLNIFYYSTNERQKNALPHKKYAIYKDREWFLTYYFTGAAHLMKKELFEQTGLYPEDFFYGMEEYDLSYRVINSGYSLAYDSSIKILHKESPEGRVTNREKLGMMWYNKSVVAWRYLPTVYFYSTVFMWGAFYLKKSGFHFSGFFRTFRKIRKIRTGIPTDKINSDALAYLRKVKARLWY